MHGLPRTAIIGAAVLTVGVATAVAGPKGDKVQGKGWNNPPNPNNVAQFRIDAKSGPNGENPKGKVRFKTLSSGAITEGPVTCLRVQGDLAVIGVDVTKSTTTDPVKPKGLLVYVQDNGKPHKGQAVDEIRSVTIFTDDVPTVCPPVMDPDRMPLLKGDIKIRDVDAPDNPAMNDGFTR